MRSPSGSLRTCLSVLAGLIATVLLAPAAASAACSLPATPVGGGKNINDGINTADSVVYTGTLTSDVNQDYLQIPFQVGAGVKGMRIRYCYENQVAGQDNPTLDLGVYGPKQAGAANWTMDDLRGWTGSAIRIAGIGENGYSDVATYGTTNNSRKAYIPGRTNRGFTPGPVDPGTWAVELGAGWIPPGGVEFKLEITPSSDGLWADDPFQPDPYTPNTASGKAGWYQGDMHVHGEQEPGNAPIENTLDLAFSPVVPGQPKQGAGLDFITLVDHNNTNARQILGEYAGRYPDKVVIPGAEITTYRGHMNSQNLGRMVDFRTNPIWRYPDPAPAPGSTVNLDQGDLQEVPDPTTPATLFPEIDRLGGWGQLNHPTTFLYSPAECRGCAWTYDDAATGWSAVDTMEIANGIADLNHGNPPLSLNPFTPLAIKLYEKRLAEGDRITAVGSSDDHKAGADYGSGTNPIVGQATTVVYARKLSPDGIKAGVKAGQTYVKVFGTDAPDVILEATTPEGYRGIEGHSLRGRELRLKLKVTGTDGNPRPGDWSIAVLRDGTQAIRVPVDSGPFTTTYSTRTTGRYSFQLIRKHGGTDVTEAYSTPVWYTSGKAASPAPKLGAVKRNLKTGIATIRVKTVAPGRLAVNGPGVRKVVVRGWDPARRKSVKVVPTGKLKKNLRKRGKAAVKLAATFSSEWTGARTARRKIVLKQKVRKKARRKHGRRR